jgi:hypothetical protein
MSKSIFTKAQVTSIASISTDVLRKAASQIEAIAADPTRDPEAAAREIESIIRGQAIGSLLEFAQDVIRPALSTASSAR